MRISDWSSDVCSSDLESARFPQSLLEDVGGPLADRRGENREGLNGRCMELVEAGMVARRIGAFEAFENIATIGRGAETGIARLDRKDRKSTRLNSSH